TVHADNRDDLAFGLGFVHGQDRFFEMDLSRRFAAGGLAALFGPAVPGLLERDRPTRGHRFRAPAPEAVASLTPAARWEVTAYARGVNAGYDSLGARPFEYLLLQARPEPWREEDSVLVMYSMFMSLQGDTTREAARGRAKESLPAPLYNLLTAAGD